MIRRCVVLTGTARFRACSTYKPTFSDHAGRVTNLDDNKAFEIAATWIKSADVLLFSTGAGHSVDSGLPDFRGPEGFWKAYPPMKKLGLKLAEMSNPDWFRRDPEFAWGFWAHRRELYANSAPHEGYNILRKWANRVQNLPKNDKRMAFFSFTSNVDGHWQRVVASDRLLECHGTVTHFQCVNNCTSDIWPDPGEPLEYSRETFRVLSPSSLPKCKHCNSLARPNVLMFGDWEWNSRRTDEQEGNFGEFLSGINRESNFLVIEIGAGLNVPTVRLKSERLATEKGGKLIRINIRDPQTDNLGTGAMYNFSVSNFAIKPTALSLPFGGKSALQTIDHIIT